VAATSAGLLMVIAGSQCGRPLRIRDGRPLPLAVCGLLGAPARQPRILPNWEEGTWLGSAALLPADHHASGRDGERRPACAKHHQRTFPRRSRRCFSEQGAARGRHRSPDDLSFVAGVLVPIEKCRRGPGQRGRPREEMVPEKWSDQLKKREFVGRSTSIYRSTSRTTYEEAVSGVKVRELGDVFGRRPGPSSSRCPRKNLRKRNRQRDGRDQPRRNSLNLLGPAETSLSRSDRRQGPGPGYGSSISDSNPRAGGADGGNQEVDPAVYEGEVKLRAHREAGAREYRRNVRIQRANSRRARPAGATRSRPTGHIELGTTWGGEKS